MTEYLSFLKAGVPMGIRVKFYKKLGKLFKEHQSQQTKNPKIEQISEYFPVIE